MLTLIEPVLLNVWDGENQKSLPNGIERGMRTYGSRYILRESTFIAIEESVQVFGENEPGDIVTRRPLGARVIRGVAGDSEYFRNRKMIALSGHIRSDKDHHSSLFHDI